MHPKAQQNGRVWGPASPDPVEDVAPRSPGRGEAVGCLWDLGPKGPRTQITGSLEKGL